MVGFLLSGRVVSTCMLLLRFRRVAQKEGDHTFEPYYNGALLAFNTGDFQEAFDLCTKVGALQDDARQLCPSCPHPHCHRDGTRERVCL